MFVIAKKWTFSASHQLLDLPEDHKCRRLHGHNYELEVQLHAEELDEHEFVRDYGELTKISSFVEGRLDHRHLNDLLDQPTAERLAFYLYEIFHAFYPEVCVVHISETPRTWAEYRP